MANTGTTATKRALSSRTDFSGRYNAFFSETHLGVSAVTGLFGYEADSASRTNEILSPTRTQKLAKQIYLYSVEPINIEKQYPKFNPEGVDYEPPNSAKDALKKLHIPSTEGYIRSPSNQTSDDNAEANKVTEKVKAYASALTVTTEVPKSLLIEKLSPIVEVSFQNIASDDIRTHTHQTSVTIADQRYDILIKRIGKDVELAKTIQEWLADPKHPNRPPLYKDRPGTGWNKKGAPEYFQDYYGKFVGALYRNDLGKLDPELMHALVNLGKAGKFDIGNKLPKLEEKIIAQGAKLAEYGSGLDHVHKVLTRHHRKIIS